MARRLLSAEQVAWLRARYGSQPIRQTLREFNRLFRMRLSYDQLRNANRRHGFGRALKPRASTFTRRETAFLIERLPTQPHERTQIAFCRRFGWMPRDRQIKDFVARHPQAKGAPNTGRFRKRHMRNEALPLYSERWRRKHGQREYLAIKVPGPSPYASQQQGRDWHWVRKAVWVWEQAHGPVPGGHAVVHLDGDPARCELENLEVVPHGVLARLNHWNAPPYAGPEANPARIRLAQLQDGLHARGKAA